jgi:hypothetical protein
MIIDITTRFKRLDKPHLYQYNRQPLHHQMKNKIHCAKCICFAVCQSASNGFEKSLCLQLIIKHLQYLIKE